MSSRASIFVWSGFARCLFLLSVSLLIGPLVVQTQAQPYPGSVDLSFDPGSRANLSDPFMSLVNAIAVQPDGRILVAGSFTNFDGKARSGIVRLNPDGSTDLSFMENAEAKPSGSRLIQCLAIDEQGRILVGGDFPKIYGLGPVRIARLNADGRLDTSFNPDPGAGGLVSAIALQPDGKVIIGGNFLSVNRTLIKYLARLNADGTLDLSFVPPTDIGSIASLSVQSDGKILIGGWLKNCGGRPQEGIARLNADGSADSGFTSGIVQQRHYTAVVNAIQLAGDGKMIVAGAYDAFPSAASLLVRLNQDGSLDKTFQGSKVFPGPIALTTLVSDPDGKLLVGGMIKTDVLIGQPWRARLILRLQPDGQVDLTFYDMAKMARVELEHLFPSVAAMALQQDGKLLVGGSFNEVNEVPRKGIARLLGTSVPDLSNPSMDSDRFSVSFPTAQGQTYVLEFKDSLAGTNWQRATTIVGDNTRKWIQDTNSLGSNRFYRVRVE